jgi:dTDP-4-amino-4,6-dideoxygalactose transaminase
MKTYPLFKAHIDSDEALKNLKRVFESGYLNEGEQVIEFENSLKPWLGKNLTLLNSCTSALHLALHLADVNHGDHVVTTPMTCVASNTPIKSRGANVVWADIDPHTGMMTAETVEASLTDKTKAVIFVGWAGNLGDLWNVHQVCQKHKIPLIFDAAHSFAAKWNFGTKENPNFKLVSEVVDYTCYSFQAIKHITSGDGGAIVTKRDEKAKARRLRWFGLDRDSAKDEKGDWRGQQWDADIVEAGYKFNMNNISAAIGLSQIRHVDRVIEKHKKNSRLLDELFANNQKISPILRANFPIDETPRWVYTIRTPHRDDDRLKVVNSLNTIGIKAGLVHVPNDNYTCFKDSKRDLPGVREFSSTQFSIPCGWWLEEEDIRYIAEKVIHVIERI